MSFATSGSMETDLPWVARLAYGSIFLLLTAVTVGVGYITFIDWRDRRRRNEAERQARRSKRR
ncbi:hypothetical protein ACVW0Q_001271 [Thermostichus sp. MS-CIW-21]|uniref:hypothetical protein n=2 Tax=unclassified Synechococcus TaxID=2626047 RepID=UPI00006948F0|nr:MULTISPECIES: hypothetical protein [unclassified Synechococcus]PIK89584.1 hypothetical protein SYN65AY6A5_11465 [Synechococcus sp. 65AY6A5]PIK97654.1 hypothetical protein SYN63AY4M1_05750 [Synechococcus sp. 63AY4M1]PIL01625.1 hypothetical protein SYN65AY640_08305 [Synechococcus sp. 65AY640]ABD00879.1 hypothetical protein CYA_2777 [Synechococcus sp. JA-3-3Ab]PIK86346.1 hypothetical protein SYN63AY4M2_07750 [Synechococcus sp. 63AY4M2]